MLLFVNGATIPQPANWPNGIAWNTGQHNLAQVFLDSQQFVQNRANFTPGYTIMVIDESAVANISRADDLFDKVNGVLDEFGLYKYYADSSSPQNLFERIGWVPRPGTYTPNPANDILVTTARSAEKAAFEDNLQTVLADLASMHTTTDTTVAQLNTDKQKMAQYVRFLFSLFNRLFRPDS